MDDLVDGRAAWLARHILPHELMLRRWLVTKPLGGLEVDDVVQETYAILASLADVDNIRDPRSYAFQVAHSVIHAHYKRSRIVEFRALTETDLAAFASEAPSPERETSDREFMRAVKERLEELPKNCRDVLILRRLHQLSHRAIARRLGVSENSVEKLLAKATRILMDSFGRGGSRKPQSSTKVNDSVEDSPKKSVLRVVSE